MFVLQKWLWFCVVLCLLSGCYEDEAEVALNSDGSGTLKLKLVLSERLIVASSDSGGSENTPPATKEKVLEQIGQAIDVTSIKQTDLPDGGRVIEVEGAFSKPEQFFLSEFCQKTIKLRLAPAGDGKAAIYCDMEDSSSGGPNLTRLYGLAKGLHIKRTVHLPAEIEKTNGHWVKATNTVSWVTDLRNRQGLARTKLFIEGPDEGSGFAVFNTSGLKFSLPLKIASGAEKPLKAQEGQQPIGPAGLNAKVLWVSLNKKIRTDSNTVELSDLIIGIEVSWDEGRCPVECEIPVLLNAQDGRNNDLVPDGGHPGVHQGKIFSRDEKDGRKEVKVKAKTPAKDAKKLKNIEGYVNVVTELITKTVVLENIQGLVGKESTGNPVLDKLNCKIEAIDGREMKIKIDGGYNTIKSVAMMKENGSKNKKLSSSGGSNDYTCRFREEISKGDKCELEVVVDQKAVKVPFSIEEILLP